MTRLFAAAMAIAMAMACGSAQQPTSRPPARPDAGSEVAMPQPGADARTPAECEALVSHVIALELAERPPEHKLDEPEQTRVRAAVRERYLAECRGLDAKTYRCLLAAGTTAELVSCT